MAKASTQPRPSWEQLSDSSQRIYLALAEGDQQRARQLYQQDQPQRRRQRRRATRVQPNAVPKAAARDLRGFVVRGRRWEPQEMADAEAWKRRQRRQ
jgi:hypothetical protein